MEEIVDKIMDMFESAIEAENEEREATYKKAITKLFNGDFSQTDVIQDIMDTLSYAIHCEAVQLSGGSSSGKILNIHEGALKAAYKTKLLEIFEENDKLKGGDE